MEITIPSKTVEVCDFCHSEGYLRACDVCERKYCLIHEGTVPGSGGHTHVCRDCAEREDVREVCDTYAKKLGPIFKRRDEALKKLEDATRDR